MQKFKMTWLLIPLMVFLATACSETRTSSSSSESNPNPLPNSHHDGLPPKPVNLLVGGNTQPRNVHLQTPGLSWQSLVEVQLAYQIQVASSQTKLIKNTADLWDSGKVADRRSLNIQYSGKTLNARQQVFWRVRIWANDSKQEAIADNAPHASEWSDIKKWEMGLLSQADWSAKWLQAPKPAPVLLNKGVTQWATLAGTVDNNDGTWGTLAIPKLLEMPPAQLFRYSFNTTKKMRSARLYSTAAGYYEVFINGQKVDDRIMDPGQTDFDKRILYNTDDVANMLKQGDNAIAVHLGSGWYHENVAFSKVKSLAYGEPAFIAQLEILYADGSRDVIDSNGEWKSHPSHIVKEGIFSGEVFDANRHTPDWNQTSLPQNINQWQHASVLNSWPTESLEPQLLPPIKAEQKLAPIALYHPKPDVWVFDFGQNFTGIPTVDLSQLNLTNGQILHFRYAEWADLDGNISQKSGGGFATLLNQVDTYIASGDERGLWRPTFTWHGFRYVEVSGLLAEPDLTALTAQLVKSSVEEVGQFSTSNPHINRIHQTALWGYKSNLVSVPLDCPIRERAGWTGDAHAALITGNYNFNMQTFWQKYLDDFKTATFIAPAIVPGKRTLGKSIDWAVAEVFIAWEHYQHYQDEHLLHDQYQSLQKYMDFGQSQLSEFLISKGYGDWCDPVREPAMPRIGGKGVSQHTSVAITSTALFARAADLMSRIAKINGNQADYKQYKTLYENISKEFHKTFYQLGTGHYGSQTADAMALRFGLTPAPLEQSVADALNRDVLENWNGHSSVGALGQTWLYLALSDYGYANTAYNIFTAKGYPGFHYLFDDLRGTTLWERKGQFDPTSSEAPERSLNHPFHAGYDGWFYQGLGGIRPMIDSPGFQHFMLKPVFPDDLASADVSFKTGYGKINSSWKRDKDRIIWKISVPPNSTAHIVLQGQENLIRHSGEYRFEINSEKLN